MAYCIMNIDKQGRPAVYGLQIEANRQPGDEREFHDSDIDETKTQENIFLRKTENWNHYITEQIHAAGMKERKDSVVMITGVYTASTEWFETHTKDEWLQYFQDCLKFHDETYGHCFNAVIHLDETMPHMQVASVPLIEDEKGMHLSAKMIMGNRTDYRLRQDRFAEQVGLVHGMERGERRDPAERKAHTTKREWQIATQEERLKQTESRLQDKQVELDGIEHEIADSGRLRTAIEVQETPAKKTIIGDRVTVSREDYDVLRATAAAAEELQRQNARMRAERQAAKKQEQARLDAIAARETKAAEAEQHAQDALERLSRSYTEMQAAVADMKPLYEEHERLQAEVNQYDKLMQSAAQKQYWKPVEGNVIRYRDEGRLYAVYDDGSYRKVGSNRNGGLDNKTLQDEQTGKARLCIIRDEPVIEVPKRIYEQMRDLSRHGSKEVRDFIAKEEMLEHRSQEQNRGHGISR